MERFKYSYTHWRVTSKWKTRENLWCPTDTKENWDNIKHLSEKNGWTENNVSYKLNSYGFRHHEDFCEDRNALIALGCSNTFGIGVNYEQTWPYYVAKELGMNPINLGQPGGSIQACYRVAAEWVPIIKPNVVMWFIPDPSRRELWHHQGGEDAAYNGYGPDTAGSWQTNPKIKNYFEVSNESEDNVRLFKQAHLAAMFHVCRETKLILVEVGDGLPNWPELKLTEGDGTTEGSLLARDNMHPGPKVHRKFISPLFLKAFRDI